MTVRVLIPLFALLLVAAAPAAPLANPAPTASGPVAPAPGDDFKDEVHLTSGKVRKGLVVYENDNVVILRVGSKETKYSKLDVEKVVSRTRGLARVLGLLEGTAPNDAQALLNVAAEADDAGLEGEAELIRLQALIADPDNEEAHLALGHKSNSKGWRYKVGSKWKSFDDWREHTGKWKERYEFRTSHFDIETDLRLDLAVVAALDLERAYRAFYDLLREELELKDIGERMKAQIHADDKSYPEPGDGRYGYFSPSDLMFFVLGTTGDVQSTITHEICHQILYYATKRTKGARGSIPAWVDEGLAQYMQLGARRGLNGVLIETGAPAIGTFLAHATADKPYDLNRMLTMQSSDFAGGTDTGLKYAQAYTLVHFMLHGSNGKYRDGFFSFLRSAWQGKSSMSHFKDVVEDELDLDMDDFEASWTAYVNGTAGTR
jgi:hypothetical protein